MPVREGLLPVYPGSARCLTRVDLCHQRRNQGRALRPVSSPNTSGPRLRLGLGLGVLMTFSYLFVLVLRCLGSF